jgi:hypothetical protein
MAIFLQRRSVLASLGAFVMLSSMPIGFADDAVHIVSGAVKHIDKGTKTMIVKADDGTEHTIKWTGKTSLEGINDAGKDIKEGSRVSVKYTEKGGEKTAVGIKDISKETKKGVE